VVISHQIRDNQCIANKNDITFLLCFMYLLPSSLGSKLNPKMRASLFMCFFCCRVSQVGRAR